MPIDPRDLTPDGRPVGWSENKQHVDALNNAPGAFGCFGGLVVVAVVIFVIGIIAFFSGRIWEFVTTWKPGGGTYAAHYQLGSSNTALDHIVVADDTITFYLVLQPKAGSDPSKPSGFLCPSDAAPTHGLGQNVMVTAKHLWDVYEPEVLKPDSWECKGKEGQRLTFPAGQPMTFWARFPLTSKFDLNLAVGLRIEDTAYWSDFFEIDDLSRG